MSTEQNEEGPDTLEKRLAEAEAEIRERHIKSTASESGWVPAIAGAIVVGGVIVNEFFANELGLSPVTRLWIFVILAIALGVFILAGLAYVYREHPHVAGITNFVMLLLVVAAFSLVPAVLLGETERVVSLKLAGIAFLSLLPGWFYLQYVAVKGRTLWDEYVLNLFRLHVDDYSHLPEPPRGSFFHEIWRQNKGDEPSRGENLYEMKFEGLYGQTLQRTGEKAARFQGENFFPVIVATLLLAVAWAMALEPGVVMNLGFLPGETGRLGRLTLPDDPLRFGFAGAYFYILQMLVRRYYQDDLKTDAYINATVRVIIVALLVITLHVVWPDWKGEIAFAFFIGIFPQVGLQALRAIIAVPLRPFVPSLKTRYPLSDLDGMNIWYESRLLEEGIEDLQNLATANVVDVLLRTRIPVDRLVDWIDQAHLYLHVGNDDGSKKDSPVGLRSLRRAWKGQERPEQLPSSREKLKRLGIRTATDLENVLKSESNNAESYKWVLNDDNTPHTPPSVTETIRETLKDEPNLHHVRAWKEFSKELEKRRKLEPTG